MLRFDHVILTVGDLDRAAAGLSARHGLTSVPGGRHPGHGTANRIVPLGPDYLELMAVVDAREAAQSAMGRWVAGRGDTGEAPGGLCLRTSSIDVVAARLGLTVRAMSRQRPDGVVLAWRLAGLDEMVNEGVPFFIQWEVTGTDHPGGATADHISSPEGIAWVELGGDPERVAQWLGHHDLDIRLVGAGAGVRRVAIAASGADIILG